MLNNELNKLDIKRKKTSEIIVGFTLTNVFKEVFKVIKGIDTPKEVAVNRQEIYLRKQEQLKKKQEQTPTDP
ncbi:TPA: carbon storage regulator CsrA [Legionella pneumophila]